MCFLADTSWLLHGYKRYKGETLVPCHSTPSTLDGFALTSNEIWFCQTRALCSLEERHLGYDLSTLSSQNTLLKKVKCQTPILNKIGRMTWSGSRIFAMCTTFQIKAARKSAPSVLWVVSLLQFH